MPESPIFDLLSAELGATQESTAHAARVIGDVLGPGGSLLSARIAQALQTAGVLAPKTSLPAPTLHDMEDIETVPYWFTTAGTVSARDSEGTVNCDIDGTEVVFDIARAEDTAYALLAAVRHLRGGDCTCHAQETRDV